MKVCAFCGGSLSSKHYGTCSEYQRALEGITIQKSSILDQYSKGANIKDLVLLDTDVRLGSIDKYSSRLYVEIKNLLKAEGVYDPYSREHMKTRTEKVKSTMLKKYGVVNNGQRHGHGFGEQNKIPYKTISYLTESFEEYEKEVIRLTKKNLRAYKGYRPAFCEYTGVKFADEEGPVNPNDPRKRTVDHVIPVIVCYLNYIPAAQAASLSNIKFCIRYANSVKGNSTLESFLPLALKIREVFENEGYECKPISSHV